ncbi:hypothetical protein [Microbacterium sp. SLBN-146]|uniref:hypothetical protein n=1 Tax=Microbacterium sp. SLBN-146 TaxID=2768457 RepID=UPI00114F7ADF|nr:hypothetical protein [Microbacterium sp. SLBN-146]TQJ32683.1 hypothetical protein FBY39_3197 [Microbacterium sp. SLBN-146]
MRWDRFFDDLEDQLASEWEAERAALDTEAERLRLSRVTLRERFTVLASTEAAAVPISIELSDRSVLRCRVTGVGADWVALQADEGGRDAVLIPFASILSVGMPHVEVLRSARPAPRPTNLSDRMTFGFMLRDLVRRRVGVAIGLVHGRALTGTIDRAGADHLDLALHDRGAPRRNDVVTGHRLVPLTALAWVRFDDPAVR